MHLTKSGTTAFKASALIAIDPEVIAADRDGFTLSLATVEIRGNYHFREDLLCFTPSAATGPIIAIFTLESGTLRMASFGNRATRAHWQAALDSVIYSNTAATPNPAPRTITISVTSVAGPSNAVLRTITIVPTPSALCHKIDLAGTPLPSAASGAVDSAAATLHAMTAMTSFCETNGTRLPRR